MKNLILVAALGAALAGCDNAAEESDEPAAEAPAPTEAVAAESSAGRWQVTQADGTTFTSTLNADGTYQDTDVQGAVTESGTWEDRPDGKTCFDPAGGDDTVICFTAGEPAEDGSIVVTPDNGSGPLTIRRIT